MPQSIDTLLQNDCVCGQLTLLRLRNTHPAFGPDGRLEIGGTGSTLVLTWRKDAEWISLQANRAKEEYSISGTSL